MFCVLLVFFVLKINFGFGSFCKVFWLCIVIGSFLKYMWFVVFFKLLFIFEREYKYFVVLLEYLLIFIFCSVERNFLLIWCMIFVSLKWCEIVVWKRCEWNINIFLFKLLGMGWSWRNFFIKIICILLNGLFLFLFLLRWWWIVLINFSICWLDMLVLFYINILYVLICLMIVLLRFDFLISCF